MRTQGDSRQHVQSVIRAVDLLNAFTLERSELGVSELAAIVGLNRTTVHRLLVTLEHCGLVHQDARTHKYRLGARMLQFSNTFLQTNDIRTAASGPLAGLRDATRETSALHLREGMTRVVVAQVESPQELRMTYPRLGEPIPLHLGAPGKAILAHLPLDELDQYLSQPQLVATTPYSITNPERLRRDLALIREQGYAISRQERRLAVVSIAAPVFDRLGDVVASVNITGPIQRLRHDEADALVPLVVDTARAISQALGYLGPARMVRKVVTTSI